MFQIGNVTKLLIDDDRLYNFIFYIKINSCHLSLYTYMCKYIEYILMLVYYNNILRIGLIGIALLIFKYNLYTKIIL